MIQYVLLGTVHREVQDVLGTIVRFFVLRLRLVLGIIKENTTDHENITKFGALMISD
jgi:hypothetical protein